MATQAFVQGVPTSDLRGLVIIPGRRPYPVNLQCRDATRHCWIKCDKDRPNCVHQDKRRERDGIE